MKKKAILSLVLGGALALMLAGQTTRIIRPDLRADLTKIAPLKIATGAAWERNGDFSIWVTLSRSGHPVSGSLVKIGTHLLPERQPGYYDDKWNMPVQVGQSIILTVTDSYGVTRTATATIHNTVKITQPANGAVFSRAQVSSILVRWSFAAASVPVHLFVGGTENSMHYSQSDVAGGQFNLPLAIFPSGFSDLWIHVNLPAEKFIFSGPAAADSQGAVGMVDHVRIVLK